MSSKTSPYVRHSFDDEDRCVVVEIKEVPAGWEAILSPKRSGITLAAALAAVVAWVTVAIQAINAFAG